MNARVNKYDIGLDKNAANFVALSPLTFLRKAATVFPDRCAVVHGDLRRSWADVYRRSRRLASALVGCGIGYGDTVAVMLPNTPPMVEAHFGIPMTGGVLNALNTRLDAEALAFMLEHGEARVLVTDREFSEPIGKALRMLAHPPIVIDVDDSAYFQRPGASAAERAEGEAYVRRPLLGRMEYEDFLAGGDPHHEWSLPSDEWNAIALGYTSGTTGNPKGVVTHHRGAYLNAVCNAVTGAMPQNPIYLWTLPMFHCNGWCFPWTIAALAGTNVCLRRVDPAVIFSLIREHRVTHYCGAPIVHNMLINAPPELRAGIDHKVTAFIAGSAPPVAVIEGMARMGFDLHHVYGLTEVYGPAAVCVKDPDWSSLSLEEQAEKNGRQGVAYLLEEDMQVLDPDTMRPVPHDGSTMGEIFFRGNITMKGYLKNPTATEEAFKGGWFHSGDLAVVYPDGYAKIKDRSKDIIISGGENISTIEVEDVLYRHPAVLEAAVVAKPDDRWGETPCAFVTLKDSASGVTAEELIEFCRSRLARYKVPKHVVFGSLPKTSTGKIQKFQLRQLAKDI
jgi:fatty-acyl-CoA synthase